MKDERPTIANHGRPVAQPPVVETNYSAMTEGDCVLFVVGIVFGLCLGVFTVLISQGAMK